MLASPDTEQLGLRGLFLEAERENETEAAMQFAERALRLNPKLGWAADALFDLQCRSGDFAGAIDTLTTARKHGHVDKATADRRRAVLLTAQAQAKEDMEADKALALAGEAHSLAPDLVPAAAIAGRLLASRGQTARAAKIIETAWKRSPHPELATVYAYVRPGDSPRDRLDRVRKLVQMTPNSIEAPIALAETAIASRDFAEARRALEPLLHERLTQRVCKLMAHIESSEGGDKGRVREWLARAVNAPRDPAWTADGYTSDRWLAVSPVTGALDVFKWRVPVDELDKPDSALMNERMEALVALGTAADRAVPATASTIEETPSPVPAPSPAVAPSSPVDEEPRTIEAEPVTTARPMPRPAASTRPVVVDVAGTRDEPPVPEKSAHINGHAGDPATAAATAPASSATGAASVRMARIKSG
jgi:HemY protein